MRVHCFRLTEIAGHGELCLRVVQILQAGPLERIVDGEIVLDKRFGELVRFRCADKVLRKVHIAVVEQRDAVELFHRREESSHLANVLHTGFGRIAHRVVV